jgi:hypothetical protein
VEADSPRGKVIRWSQPEIALYDDDPAVRMSYPDLVEDGGDYYLTETQKDVARVHKLDRALIEGLWAQFEAKGVARDGLVTDRAGFVPNLRTGFSLELWVQLQSTAAGQTLLDNRTADGKGFALVTAA